MSISGANEARRFGNNPAPFDLDTLLAGATWCRNRHTRPVLNAGAAWQGRASGEKAEVAPEGRAIA